MYERDTYGPMRAIMHAIFVVEYECEVPYNYMR
jgi:hypothetical protein